MTGGVIEREAGVKDGRENCGVHDPLDSPLDDPVMPHSIVVALLTNTDSFCGVSQIPSNQDLASPLGAPE